AEDGIRGFHVTGVQTCALPIFGWAQLARRARALRAESESCRVRRQRSGALARRRGYTGRCIGDELRHPATRFREFGRAAVEHGRSEERRVGKECKTT